jgi:8-oxo-dGTP pyrophosphatase MutT (NUDIX family)
MFAKDHKCSNCGKNGHNYKQCVSPVTSYGIIVYRARTNDSRSREDVIVSSDLVLTAYENTAFEYLMIQRRDSLGYIEILRGKYRITDEIYLKTQINGMTDDERRKICTESFDFLWSSLWQNGNVPAHYHKNEQDTARIKFNELVDTGVFQRLCISADKQWPTPEWGFPKGRRDSRESDIDCAVRELWEETGMPFSDIKILENIDMFQENFYGTNNIHYCHKYFIASCDYNEKHDYLFNSSNPHIAREIGDIRWFRLEDAIKMIRSENKEKREVLLSVDYFLKNYCPLLKINRG